MIKGLSKVTSTPADVGKDPIAIFRSYELEMRLKELIEIHCASVVLAVCMKSSRANRVKPSSEQRSSPFTIGGRGVAFARTRPAPPVIYSALVLASLKGSSNEADSG